MEKDQVERGVNEILAVGDMIHLTHKGNHRWESVKIATNATNSGIFSRLFSHYSVTVDAKPCEGAEYKDFSTFRINVRWAHNAATGGGSNGISLDYFYHHPTAKFLTWEAASELYWAKRDQNV